MNEKQIEITVADWQNKYGVAALLMVFVWICLWIGQIEGYVGVKILALSGIIVLITVPAFVAIAILKTGKTNRKIETEKLLEWEISSRDYFRGIMRNLKSPRQLAAILLAIGFMIVMNMIVMNIIVFSESSLYLILSPIFSLTGGMAALLFVLHFSSKQYVLTSHGMSIPLIGKFGQISWDRFKTYGVDKNLSVVRLHPKSFWWQAPVNLVAKNNLDEIEKAVSRCLEVEK